MPTAKRIANKNLATARKPIASKGRLVHSADARFEAWLKDFDARMADLTSRQDTLMRKLGIEPPAGLRDAG
jgi:hypothetical protein